MTDQTRQASEEIRLFQPDQLADPYAMYARLRAVEPVYWYAPMNTWVLTSYETVDAALRDARLSSSLAGLASSAGAVGAGQGWQVFQGLYAFLNNSLVFSDPPRHTRLRELVSQAFTPRAVEAMRPRIQALVDGFLDAVASHGRMDVVRDLAYPLPIAVITSLLGAPLEDRDQLKEWCDALLIPFGKDPAALTPDERTRAAQAGDALSGYVRTLIQQVRAQPRDDLLSALVQAAAAGDRLSDDELFANVVLFLIAGHENLTSLLGNSTLALLRHPDQLAKLRDDAALLPHAVEELIRYVTPNQYIRRWATEDVPLGGKTIQQGQFLLLALAAANRDPAHFPDPDLLDLARPPSWHLAFGHGFHYCLGAPLARMEAEIALSTLFRRFPGLRLATDQLDYADDFNLLILRSLPVAF
jgi:cytochrome P450